jgi:ribulose-5-phosphate 4-epimerase/fuculose-1-phosphate aldolase
MKIDKQIGDEIMDTTISASEFEQRSSIIKWGKELYDNGMVRGSGGNISVKLHDSILLTPTGFFLGHLTEDSISKTDLDGNLIHGLKPTKELPMHLATYKARSHANAVLHLHSPYATAMASTLSNNEFMPIFLPSVAIKVGKIKIVDFELPGTQELANVISEAMKFGPAVLLSHHGIITTGKNLMEAVSIAYEIEENAHLYYITGGKIKELSNETVNQLTSIYK